MKVKLRGGPYNNKRYEIDNGWSDRFEVRQPVTSEIGNYRWTDSFPAELKFRRGHYSRSNMHLKDGTSIFIWMGWYE